MPDRAVRELRAALFVTLKRRRQHRFRLLLGFAVLAHTVFIRLHKTCRNLLQPYLLLCFRIGDKAVVKVKGNLDLVRGSKPVKVAEVVQNADVIGQSVFQSRLYSVNRCLDAFISVAVFAVSVCLESVP